MSNKLGLCQEVLKLCAKNLYYSFSLPIIMIIIFGVINTILSEIYDREISYLFISLYGNIPNLIFVIYLAIKICWVNDKNY